MSMGPRASSMLQYLGLVGPSYLLYPSITTNPRLGPSSPLLLAASFAHSSSQQHPSLTSPSYPEWGSPLPTITVTRPNMTSHMVSSAFPRQNKKSLAGLALIGSASAHPHRPLPLLAALSVTCRWPRRLRAPACHSTTTSVAVR